MRSEGLVKVASKYETCPAYINTSECHRRCAGIEHFNLFAVHLCHSAPGHRNKPTPWSTQFVESDNDCWIPKSVGNSAPDMWSPSCRTNVVLTLDQRRRCLIHRQMISYLFRTDKRRTGVGQTTDQFRHGITSSGRLFIVRLYSRPNLFS